jgi:hypothetical protein
MVCLGTGSATRREIRPRVYDCSIISTLLTCSSLYAFIAGQCLFIHLAFLMVVINSEH